MRPKVSVVSPVYNQELYIAESIESVLAQNYDNLEYIIVDNASSDASGEIARQYAKLDSKLRVISNSRTLSMVENWNLAMEAIAPDSVYTQMLHGDDRLLEGCIDQKVQAGESHPGAGIISCLRWRGTTIECQGLPPDQTLISGREVGRGYLSRSLYAFSPSTGMLRSDLVRSRAPKFYPDRYLHCDIAAYLDILDRTDVAFCHSILNFSRLHEESVTSTIAEKKQTIVRETLASLSEFGQRYFSSAELQALKSKQLKRCYRTILRGVLRGENSEYFRYHLEGIGDARADSIATFLSRFLISLVPNTSRA